MIWAMSSFLARDQTRLAYREAGTGDPVVCLPGGPMQASAYLGDLGGLSAHRRLILLDHRGTGGSQIPRDPLSYRCDHLVDDVEALREHLRFDRLDLLPADVTYRNMDLALDSVRKSTRRIRQLLRPLADDYDVVFLDCPPSMSLVSENVLNAADTVLVPLIPTTLSLRTFEQLTEFVGSLDQRPPQLLGFFSMVDGRKRLHREIMAELPSERADIAETVIPALSLVEQMGVHRAPLPAFAPRSPAARHYEALWAEALATTGEPRAST